jgi:hypothetical protein
MAQTAARHPPVWELRLDNPAKSLVIVAQQRLLTTSPGS